MRSGKGPRLQFGPFGPLGLLGTALVVLLVLTAGACSSDDDARTTRSALDDALVGTWTLDSASVDGTDVTAQRPAASITFSVDGTFQGSSPCNTLSGTWTDDDGALGLELGPMTQMACADPAVQAQETAITTGFSKVTAAEKGDGTLTLTGDGVTFRFVSGPEGLVGSYDVTGVNDGNGAVVSSALTEALTVDFAADGLVRGFDGCNSFTTSYELDGASLSIGPDTTTTLIGCPGNVTALAGEFNNALRAVATWERNGEVVSLRDASGATQLTLISTP